MFRKVLYGKNIYFDVTNKANKISSENNFIIVNNENFSDPEKDVRKELILHFQNGTYQIFNEGECVLFNRDLKFPSQISSEYTPRIAYITAIYGTYESSCKKPCEQSIPSDFICFTNCIKPENANGWIIDKTQYHLSHNILSDQNEDLRNSMKNNTHTFNVAKFYKQNFHRIPILQKYDIVIWLDGTVQILHPRTSEYIYFLIKQNHNLITFEHMREGKLEEEVAASHFDRYTSTFWFDQYQPYQDIDEQYNFYLQDGFNQDLWKDIEPDRKEYGLWVTCFLAFDMKNQETIKFLDEWYLQTLRYTTQDQIGFPYVCQKLEIYPYSLPDDIIKGDGHSITDLYLKHQHGK